MKFQNVPQQKYQRVLPHWEISIRDRHSCPQSSMFSNTFIRRLPQICQMILCAVSAHQSRLNNADPTWPFVCKIREALLRSGKTVAIRKECKALFNTEVTGKTHFSLHKGLFFKTCFFLSTSSFYVDFV